MDTKNQKDAFLTSRLGDIPVTTDGVRYLIDSLNKVLSALDVHSVKLIEKELIGNREKYKLD